MMDRFMISDDGFHNVVENGTTIGFRFKGRLPYYRGLGLSMIEEIAVAVDGQAVPRGDIRLTLRGRTWTLDDMETEYGDRWNFGEEAQITVLRPGGLAPGQHRIEIAERLRISYLPFVPTTKFAKDMDLAA
jgi:hypothetical protein